MSVLHRYFDNLSSLLHTVITRQEAALETAAQKIAQCQLNGGMLYTFGTGHGHLLALEIFYRAGGLVRICPILDEKLMLHVSAAKSTHEERDEALFFIRWQFMRWFGCFTFTQRYTFFSAIQQK